LDLKLACLFSLNQKLTAGFLLIPLFIFCLLFSTSAKCEWRPTQSVGLTNTPPIQVTDLEGKKVELGNFKGKVVLLNFWASWCEPCRAEFDELIHLQEKYKSRGLVVLAVNLAEMKPRINQYLKSFGISENAIQILRDQNSLTYKTWKARGLPNTFLINRAGKVEAVWVGAIEDADSSDVKLRIEKLINQ
jgi:thiol-disulfide isomerase/thioredoxin